MPSAIFSHQAPGLALKIKYPHKFDGTALCISAIVPDLLSLFGPFFAFTFRNFTHSILGVILSTVPLTIILTVIFCTYIGPFCAKLAKKNGFLSRPLRYMGMETWDNLKKKKYNHRFFLVATYSAFIGGFTHLLLDLPSHEYIEIFFPWVILQIPDFLLYSIIDFGSTTIGTIQIDRNFTIFHLIWFIETLITLVLALYFLRYMKNRNLISKWYDET